ncbi:DNA polymerase III subunit gamma/tau [Candidatus Hakubella thermalkaliphila]|uniref:DNA polymerase III subunit gamma/tau n=1 Tax=Candidatus Hakubella thermalkaliphila TaxID=2754717 RepID=A0A6V8PV31_9ACTN|nr:DNA polymerase III subunit gamma/tau [Candidatus Hakubella thermalkaliphila]GFP24815.1 DNA polymerase III subunit gamma/tau [Candidatus Hakubella thermalkaliphila]GFP34876.1 DNA polymerase III subunit gamma/tau [Candidatus Hakubella thermalkaliphila]
MQHISLYRRWRPQTFEEVIGQNHITKTLANAIRYNQLSHAFIFCGPRGTGKTSTARILAKSINCEQGPTPNACNQCQSCIQISNGTCLDVIEIDAASNRGIDEIRALRDKIHFSPATVRTKVYIIDEVHMLTTEAFNALLKILEEPPSHVIFVLATTEPNKVLPTIMSRCQRFDFNPISVDVIMRKLRLVAQKEELEIPEDALRLVARHAAGSLRDAEGALEQMASFSGKRITVEDVQTVLGVVDVELLFEAGDLFVEKDAAEALFLVNRLFESGRDLRQFTRELLEHLRILMIIQNVDDPRSILDCSQEEMERYRAQASLLRDGEVQRFLHLFGETYREMRWDSNPRLLLELAMVKAMKVDADDSREALLARLEALESMIEKDRGSGLLRDRPDIASRVVQQKREGREPEESLAPREPAPAHGRAGSSPGPGHAVDLASQEPISFPERPDGAYSQSETTAPTLEPTTPEGKVDITEIKKKWQAILERVREKRIPTHALLLEGSPLDFRNGELTIEFDSIFHIHKEKVEKGEHKRIVEAALAEMTGEAIRIKCVIAAPSSPKPQVESIYQHQETDEESGGKARDETRERATKEVSLDPIELIKARFKAKVVQKTDLKDEEKLWK